MVQKSQRITFRSLFCIALVLIALSVLAISLTVWGLRSDAIQDANSDTGNIAVVLSEQLNRSIQSIDIVLTDVRERIQSENVTGQDSSIHNLLRRPETSHFLSERLAHLSQANFIALISKDGQLATTTLQSAISNTDLSDRDYFQHFRAGTDDTIYISSLLVSRLTGARTIFFSKRIKGVNNEFLGVVLIGLRLAYFENIYNSIARIGGLSFLLLRHDGTVLIRHPDVRDNSGQKMPAGSPWYKLAAEGGGHYRSPGYFDKSPRFVAVEPLREYPLVIDVAVTEAAALGNWYRRATLIGVGTLFALICSAFLLKSLSNQFRRLFESEAALVEKSQELQLANVHIDVALHNMSQGLCMFDGEGRLVLWNERYIQMYDMPVGIFKPGCTLVEMLKYRALHGTFAHDPLEYDEKIRAAARNGEKLHFAVELPDGRVIEVVNQPMANGGWIATHDEVTERKRAEAKIEHLAHHDVLTGLPNRAAFNERFALELEGATKSGGSIALMCLDLDRFKHVNDLFGHALGDSLLCEVARRLKAAANGTFLARIGGDEFSLIVTEGNVASTAARLAERITTALGDCIELEERKLTANVSVGVAIYPGDAADGGKLICNADAALYRAKADDPGSYRFFEPEMDRQLREDREIQHELSSALQKSEFHLVYQPEALIGGAVIGFEALLRWHHQTRGLVPPATFIPLAEESGLIIPLGEWVLRAACREAASWKSQAQLAVNLSPMQFRHGDLPGLVHSVLLETGLSPSRLELEITESVLIDDFGRAQSILRRLKNLGVRIAMDDFGTGYSSLSYLQSFPFDKIKIDRSFVSDLDTNINSAAIVHAVINLARSLKLPVLAEGVETEAQRKILSKEGCDQIQGYLIGKPLPIENYDVLVGAAPKDKEQCHSPPAEDATAARAHLSIKRPKPARKIGLR
jgi:diguanylate cyclase (GGDEF)-like protein